MKKITSVLLIFFFALGLRVWNLNQMGRTWDESFYVESGYKFINLAKKGDFANSSWYKDGSSNGPPLVLYLFGLVSILDINHYDSSGKAIFNYDYTYSRLVSVLFSSLAVVLVILVGWNYISPFVGVAAGIILSMMPLSIGYSQLSTLETFIIFFFTATIFSFINFLSAFSKKNILLTGVLLGSALMVKYTNILLIPLMLLIFLVWFFQNNKSKKNTMNYIRGILTIFAIALVTTFIIWPMPWFHLSDVFIHNAGLRYSPYSVPEVFFGKLMLVPKVYYFIYFLTTTPLLILVLFLIGLKILDHKKSWIFISILVWFIFPFIQSLYNFRQHGIRYIVEIYAPLALISAIGFDYVISKIHKIKYLRLTSLFLLMGYLFLILFRITPYYLDYFNEIVGGPKNVYEKRIFQMGWWGQGIREAAYFVEKNGRPGSKVGIALSPSSVMPQSSRLNIKKYDPNEKYDFVIVNFYNVLRERFDDRPLKKNYKVVYMVDADGAKLVTVYKHK